MPLAQDVGVRASADERDGRAVWRPDGRRAALTALIGRVMERLENAGDRVMLL